MRTGADAEIVFRRGYLHLLKKNAGNFAIVVLPRVQNLVLDLRIPKLAIVKLDGAAKRRHLNELGAGSNDADPFGPRSCPLWLHGKCI